MHNRILLGLLVPVHVMLSQSVTHELPFASTNNSLELSIENTATIQANTVKIKAQNVPVWLKFTSTEQTIGQLEGKQERAAMFTFSIEKSAPVKTKQTLSFQITTSDGQTWSKDITISVNPPDRFELFQNYPNPFNPSTTISYQLTTDAKVSLKIYDLLGREVAALVDEDKPAGYHEVRWNALTYSSGMYIYQIVYNDRQGHREFHRKTMLLVK